MTAPAETTRETGPKHARPSWSLTKFLLVANLAGLFIAGVVSLVANAHLGGRHPLSRIKLEVDTIAGAFEQYRHEVGRGKYPPNMNDLATAKAHLRRAFPQMRASELALLKPMDPAEALVFWLGGFSDDPRRPLTGRGGPYHADRAKGMMSNHIFKFDRNRLKKTANGLVFHPPNLQEPYVYIDTTRLDSGATNMPTYSSTEGGGSIGYYEPKAPIKIDFERPQILSASLDDKWGGTNGSKASKMYGESMTGPHADNLASFAPKELSKVE